MRKNAPSSTGFRVDQIDHVELFVPDRHLAADWYRRVLGLEVVPGNEHWAADPRGPLRISSDKGNTKLALFQGKPQSSRETAGFIPVAFRVGAMAFVEFLKMLPTLKLNDHRGRRVTADLVADHEGAYSIYFSDPSGPRLERTTYAYQETKAALDNFNLTQNSG